MRRITFPLILLAAALVWGCSPAEDVDAGAAAPIVSESMDTEPAGMEMVIPAEQMAIVQTGNGGAEVLAYQRVPVLQPGPGQVLIRVYAAAVNPVDWNMRINPGRGGQNTQSIPGFDVAGIVAAVGEGVSYRVGDPVFSMIGMVQTGGLNGGYSEYVIANEGNVIPKPATLTYAQAAGLGTVGYAAGRMIVPAGIMPGERVFIDGISGGVGSTAAQLALAQGAYVLGTASERHHEYLYSIGVSEVINYREVQFEDVITEPVDVVVEVVSAENATRALQIMRPGARLVSVVGTPDPAAVEAAAVIMPDVGAPGAPAPGLSEPEVLTYVGRVAQDGNLSINVDATFPLQNAFEAQEENRDGGTTGKIILIVDPANADTF